MARVQSPKCSTSSSLGSGARLFVGAWLVLAGPVAGQVTMAPEVQGEWVRADGSCEDAARLVVGADQLTLANGEYVEVFGDLGIAHSFFGPDYQGISTVVVPEASGNEPPFLLFLNADEEPGVARVDIYSAPPGTVNPAYREILEAARRRSESFSIDHEPLRLCPSTAVGGD